MGKAGMQQAKERLKIKTDPRYVDRYLHCDKGPDDIGLDANKRLTEIEAKGSYTSNTSVSKNKAKEKQSSSAKNLRRAKLMAAKKKKIGQSSTRQGGAYTQEESNLWRKISKNNGDKRHLSTHTNLETGEVQALERDGDGNVSGNAIELFKMDYFDDIKSGIEQYFKK